MLSSLSSLAAGKEGPCITASTRLHSHLPEVFWEGVGMHRHTEEDKSPISKLVPPQAIEKAMTSQTIFNPQ